MSSCSVAAAMEGSANAAHRSPFTSRYWIRVDIRKVCSGTPVMSTGGGGFHTAGLGAPIRSALHGPYQDGAKVVDVGQGRTGDDRISQRLEEAVAVVIGERCARYDAECAGPRQRIGREQGACYFFQAVDAIGV